MTARLHHYIPRCYLKGFAASRSKNARLQVMDGVTGRSFVTSSRKVAVEKDFIRIDVPGHAPDALESQMAKFEGALAQSLDRIIDTESFVDENDRLHVFNFMALLAIRNPRWREQVRRFHDDTYRVVLGMMLATRERWESQIRQMRAAGAGGGLPDLTYEQVKAFYEEGDYTVSVPIMRHIQLELLTFDKVLPCLVKRKWILLRARQGRFITCDHPVCLMWSNPEERRKFIYPPGFAMTETDVLFPLSKNLAMIGRFEGEEFVRDVHGIAVPAFNGAVVDYAERQVFAADDRFMYMMNLEEKPRYGVDLLRDERFKKPRTAED